MGVEVKTTSTCDMCGSEHIEEGAQGSIPPVGWAEVIIPVRGKGEGCTNVESWRITICPRCAKKVKDFCKVELS